MRVIIFEDEKLASERLIQLLKQIKPEAEVLTSIKSVEAGVLWLQNHDEPELIISDIQLLDGTSFEIFEQVKVNCPVIFTTAYDDFAIKAFEVNSVDYLLKPIQKEKLEKAIDKYENQKGNSSELNLEKIQELLQGEPTYKSRFLVKLGQRIKAIPVEKIAYFYSRDKLTYLVGFDGQKLPVDQTLEELDTLLNPTHYFRVNRKFLVHFDAVSDIHPYFKGRVKLELEPTIDEDIVVSSEKTPVFKKWLDN
jgi:two-component system response regulator LytT